MRFSKMRCILNILFGYNSFVVMNVPILDTKLNIPPVREHALDRAHLMGQLDRLCESGRKLALVAAPAGFGKTTLVAGWLRQRTGWRVGWLSLDREHNDPTRLLRYLAQAFGRISPGQLSELQAALDSGTVSSDDALSLLINALTAGTERLLLVFDDYHEISDARIHGLLALLLENLPDSTRLILTSRVDPPLPLSRMRARGQMVEIRADTLRFSVHETTAFLREVMQLHIEPDLAAALEARTEGWAAGLQLAALSLRGIGEVGERERFVSAFAGSHRHVVDYLAEEVLYRQPSDVLDFLLQTAVLDRFCPALCDAVTGRCDSRALLDYLDRANLFLIALDTDHVWYRYHHLFADVLRLRLRHDRPDTVDELHRRAAHWLELQGLLPESVQHAFAARDSEHAARLTMAAAGSLLARGEIETLHGWLNALPPAVILSHPRLCLDRARLLLLQHRTSGVDQLLDAAEHHLDTHTGDDPAARLLRGSVTALRAYPAHERSDFAASIDCSTRALEFFPESHVPERGACLLYRAHSLHFGGWTRQAVPHFLDAMTLLQRTQNTFSTMMCMGQLATVYELLGNLHQARAVLDDAFAWARQHGVEHLSPMAVPHARRANLLREWNALDEAEAHLKTALELAPGGRPLVTMRASVLLARVQMAQGDFAAATTMMNQARAIIRDWETDIERSYVDFNEMLLHLRQGDLDRVHHWLQRESLALPDRSAPLPNYTEQKLLVQARYLIAVGGSGLDEAIDLFDRLEAIAKTAGRTGIVIEVSVLQALARAASGQSRPAFAALAEALHLAAPQGHVRVFLDEGQPLQTLLAQIPRDHPEADYVRQLIGGTPQSTSASSRLYQTADGQLLEALSQRELQVLQCLAQGFSSNDVADQLIISVETARKHIKNIYGKLDVHNKVEAVRRAQDLHLI